MNRLLLCGATLGLISVIMGALGDHGFDLTPERAESMGTAIRYNMLYAVLIVANRCRFGQICRHGRSVQIRGLCPEC